MARLVSGPTDVGETQKIEGLRLPFLAASRTRSLWSAAFSPLRPAAMSRFCSTASQILCRCALPAVVHEGLTAHRLLLRSKSYCSWMTTGLPVLAHEVSLPAWGLRLRRIVCALAFDARIRIAFWESDPMGILDQFSFEAPYPARRRPCPTLRVPHYYCPRMARSQGGSLLLPCTTLSFATSCRFIPALPITNRPPACQPAQTKSASVKVVEGFKQQAAF